MGNPLRSPCGSYWVLRGVGQRPVVGTHAGRRCARGDIQSYGSGETYLKQRVGERDQLADVSPSRMADRIKVPVFLAAGGEDERTPMIHTRMSILLRRHDGIEGWPWSVFALHWR